MKALILSGIKWDTTLQRHHKIAKWLKELGYDVYFVEGIKSSKFSFKKLIDKVKQKKNNNNQIKNERIVKVFNYKFMTPDFYFNLYNDLKINKMISELGKEFDIIINYLPIYTTDKIIKKVNYKLLIYDCVRDFSNWGGYPKSLNKFENILSKNSDLILTDSYYLTNKFKGVQFLPSLSKEQFEVFKSNSIPKKINKVVYFGSISEHIDIDILKTISEKYELHIIGNSNVELPFKYVNHGYTSNKVKLAKEISKCDAIIIPYKGNMNGVIPAKFIESISSKLPVFINSFYDSEELKNICYVYHSKEELIELINNFKKKEIDLKLIENLVHDNIEENQFYRFKRIIEENILKKE